MAKALQLFAFLTLLVTANCLNNDLRKYSVIYGLASLADGNGTQCIGDLRDFFEGVEEKHVWALKMLDSSGGPSSGLLMGNNFWTGSANQCRDIPNKNVLNLNYQRVHQKSVTLQSYPPYKLQFVVIHFKFNNTYQQHTGLPLENLMHLGLCLPKSCTEENLKPLVESYFNKRFLEVQKLYNLDLHPIRYRFIKEGFLWMLREPWTIIMIFIVGIVSILVVTGTIYEAREKLWRKKFLSNVISGQEKYIQKLENGSSLTIITDITTTITNEQKEPSMFVQIAKCFSISSNALSLFRTKVSSEAVRPIHGLRFFGMVWVVMVHTLFYGMDYAENAPLGFRMAENFLNQIFGNSTYCVDTFLFISGFLVSHLFFKYKKDHATNLSNHSVGYLSKVYLFFTLLFNRLLRLTPIYMIIITAASMFFSYYRQASVLYFNDQLENNCANYWWRNLMYINNLYPRSEMCLSWSWYLSLDTQCFVVSTFLLILSTIWFKTSAAIMLGMMGLCTGYSAYKTYSLGFIPTLDEQLAKADETYDMPWYRVGPYFVGIIAGYILTVNLDMKLNLKRPILILCWIIFPLLNLWITFALYGEKKSLEFSTVYMSTSRTLWGIGLAWLMIACCTDNAGIINRFLSFKTWVPFSRLTYCAYLVNPLVDSIFFLGAENVYNVNTQLVNIFICACLFATFFYGFWVCLFFETPFILLSKMMMDRLKKRKHDSSNGPV